MSSAQTIIRTERRLLALSGYGVVCRFWTLLFVALVWAVDCGDVLAPYLGWRLPAVGSLVEPGTVFVVLEAARLVGFSAWRRSVMRTRDALVSAQQEATVQDMAQLDGPAKLITSLLSVLDQGSGTGGKALSALNATLGWVGTGKQVLEDACLFFGVYALSKSLYILLSTDLASVCPFFARMAL